MNKTGPTIKLKQSGTGEVNTAQRAPRLVANAIETKSSWLCITIADLAVLKTSANRGCSILRKNCHPTYIVNLCRP